MRESCLRSAAVILALLCSLAPVSSATAQERIDTTGTLQTGDQTLKSGEYFDRHVLQVRAGQEIDVRVTSSHFDPYLIVRGPTGERFENDDENGASRAARVTETARSGGIWQILVTSYEPGETGNYRLTAGTSSSASQSTADRPSTPPATPIARNSGRMQPPPAMPASAGSLINGKLEQGDAQLSSGEFMDGYRIEGRSGQQVILNLSSSDFDTYLMLRGPDGSSFDNDDLEGHGTNSGLNVTLPANGSYRLIVTSYRRGETGAYTLSASGASLVMETASSAGTSRGLAIGSAATSGALIPGRPLNGELSASDPQLDDGEYFDSYTLSAPPGTRLSLRMESTAIDTYLAAFGSGGYQVSNDDDASGSGGTNSHLDVTVPDSGVLTVVATSYTARETGPYRLLASLASAGPDQAASDAGDAGRLTLGQPVTGRLVTSTDHKGTAYLIDLEAGQAVRIALSSEDFDPLLRIEGPNGYYLENDDAASGGTLDSLVEMLTPHDGTYRVLVRSFDAQGQGAYHLSADAIAGPVPRSGFAVDEVAGSIALGQQITGHLAEGDTTYRTGEFMDVYTFTGRAGQRVTFDMASGEFDTYLALMFPGGGQETNDDRAGAEGTNSRLILTLPEDGTYHLVATSYQAGESGAYQLSAFEGALTDIVLDPRRGSSQVFVLSIGVSDYTRMNPLPLTDQDATKLVQTVQNTGLVGDAITLVNSDATRVNVEQAIARIASTIGPDDLFLLFFSGHGNKVPVARAIEADGASETIELYDAALHDYELRNLLEPVAARTLLVLDSCYSGGFDDIINGRVGRMGIFSSDSDLTSQVASKFEAGGYISHILQSALRGDADTNQDRAISAGELSEFMRTTFYRIVLSEPLEADWRDSARGFSGPGYQHIVVNRGGDGMPYEEVLVNLAAR